MREEKKSYKQNVNKNLKPKKRVKNPNFKIILAKTKKLVKKTDCIDHRVTQRRERSSGEAPVSIAGEAPETVRTV